MYDFGAVFAAHAVDGLIEVDELRGGFEHVYLLDAMHEFAELYAYQADAHAALVESVEEVFAEGDKQVVECGIGQGGLQDMGVEVGVTDFELHASGELLMGT